MVKDDDSSGASKLHTRFKKLAKRLAYPLKEEDIKYWKDVLGSIQLSLQTALHATQLEQQRIQFEAVRQQINQLSPSDLSLFQDVLKQQQNLRVDVHSGLLQQSNLIQPTLFTIKEQIESVHNNLGGLQQTLIPFTSSMSSLDTLPQIHLLMKQMNTKLDAMGPAALVTSTIVAPSTCPEATQNTVPRATHRSRGYQVAYHRCTCRPHDETRTYILWPLLLTRTRSLTYTHDCPYHAYDNRATDSATVSFPCHALGIKVEFSLKRSWTSRIYRLKPGLVFHRIVTADSPAFRLIYAMTHDKSLASNQLSRSSEELFKLFDTRQASPHDRLANGQTLLHVLCANLKYTRTWNEDLTWRSIINKLIECMPAEASERDDRGHTCVDLILETIDFPFDDSWKLLIIDLLRHGLQISISRHYMESWRKNPYGTWIEIPFADFPDPISTNDEITHMLLLRSTEGLRRLIHRHSAGEYLCQKDLIHIYTIVTRLGWVEGCQMLSNAGVRLVLETGSDESRILVERINILFHAVKSRNPDMVYFWLSTREGADKRYLQCLGYTEDALIFASRCIGDHDIVKILLSYVVEQRRQIQRIMYIHNVNIPCATDSDTLLDAHIDYVLHTLRNQGVEVPAYLMPDRERSIYHSALIYYGTTQFLHEPRKSLQMLYQAGFKEVGGAILCNKGMLPSPLISAAVCSFHARLDWRRFYTGLFVHPDRKFFNTYKWFLSKGASLSERDRDSRTTALHHIGSILGINTSFTLLDQSSIHDIASLFRYQSSDDCSCGCSTNGCTCITTYWKSEFCFSCTPEVWGERALNSPWYRLFTAKFPLMIESVAEATKAVNSRWIITELVRLVVFQLLEIRHTCCNLEFLKYCQQLDEINLSKPPSPRYSTNELQRITIEDSYLREILEERVAQFDTDFNTFNGSLQNFIEDHLLPEMWNVLDNLKKKDKALYAAERKELGIVMKYDDGDDSNSVQEDSRFEGSSEEFDDDEGSNNGEEER